MPLVCDEQSGEVFSLFGHALLHYLGDLDEDVLVITGALKDCEEATVGVPRHVGPAVNHSVPVVSEVRGELPCLCERIYCL